MTEKDKQLIEKAKNTPFIKWYEIEPEEAESDEARKILHNISFAKYYEEENRN